MFWSLTFLQPSHFREASGNSTSFTLLVFADRHLPQRVFKQLDMLRKLLLLLLPPLLLLLLLLLLTPTATPTATTPTTSSTNTSGTTTIPTSTSTLPLPTATATATGTATATANCTSYSTLTPTPTPTLLPTTPTPTTNTTTSSTAPARCKWYCSISDFYEALLFFCPGAWSLILQRRRFRALRSSHGGLHDRGLDAVFGNRFTRNLEASERQKGATNKSTSKKHDGFPTPTGWKMPPSWPKNTSDLTFHLFFRSF